MVKVVALVVKAAVVHKAQVVAQAVKIKVTQATKAHNQAIQILQLSLANQPNQNNSQTSRKPQMVILATPAITTKIITPAQVTKTKTKTKTIKQSK